MLTPTENARQEVDEMIERDVPFEHIESYIEARRDLNAELRSALWLLAWCETSDDRRRAVVNSLLSELDTSSVHA
jgi:hypothetical protein